MRTGPTKRHRRPWLVIAAFSAVGPLIGLLVLTLGVQREVRVPLQNVAGVVAFAYLIGTLPALMSGNYVVLRSNSKGTIGTFEALMVSGLIGAVTTFALILMGAQHPFSAANLKIVTLVVGVSAVAGVICSCLTRRWH